MVNARWIRLAGLCALTALTVQGVGALVPAADQAHGYRFDLAHLALLPPELPAGTLTPLPFAGWLSAAPPPLAVEPRSAPEPPRGPPA